MKLAFYETAPGEVTANYTVPAHYQSYPGVTHGGVVAAMLDEVTGRSFSHSGETRFMVTAKLEIRYRKPVPVGQPLRIVGHAGNDNGHVGHAHGEIYSMDGVVLAEADAVLVDLPEDVISDADFEALGWKVYPDEEETV
ncbi:MAG TPA: PaaI family thioesterase [Anaerolineaceae bacterium]|nr:PaaI family thioesterase [Anaerolineaceae bacterium]